MQRLSQNGLLDADSIVNSEEETIKSLIYPVCHIVVNGTCLTMLLMELGEDNQIIREPLKLFVALDIHIDVTNLGALYIPMRLTCEILVIH